MLMLVDVAHNTAAGAQQILQKKLMRAHCMMLAPLARLAGMHVSCFWNLQI